MYHNFVAFLSDFMFSKLYIMPQIDLVFTMFLLICQAFMTVIQGECETDNADTAKKPDPVLQYPYKACESHRALTQTQFGDLLYHYLTGAGINTDNQNCHF